MMEVLEKWVAPLKAEGQKVFWGVHLFPFYATQTSPLKDPQFNFFPQVPEDLMREIVRNFNKLVKDLQNQESPEAMAYLKIMGTEFGYIKAGDLKFLAENVKMYAEIFLKLLPKQV